MKENESLTEKLGRKIPPLIEKLPPKSPFRQGLIQHFAKDEDVNKVSGFLSTSPQTVKMANQTSTSPLFEIKYKPNTRREKTPKEHIKIIEDFWHDHTYPLPWKKTIKYKGKRSKKIKIELPYFSQHDTDSAIMDKFKEETKLNYCHTTLLKYKPKDIHIATQQYCVCHHCRDWSQQHQ